MFLLEEGASPQQVDAALEKFGMAMGPFRMSDLAGNDIGWDIRKRRYVEKPGRRATRASPTASASSGRFGQKTGAGWYRYEPGGRDAMPDPAVDELIADVPQGERHHAAQDRRRGDRRALHLALVNEGARILEEGIALRASDIDVVYLTGYGFPRYRGGPMFYADTVGLYRRRAARCANSRRTRTPTPRSGSRRRCSRDSRPTARRSTADPRRPP